MTNLDWQGNIKQIVEQLVSAGYTVAHNSGGYSSVYLDGASGRVRISNHRSAGLPGQRANVKLVWSKSGLRREVFDSETWETTCELYDIASLVS